MPDTPILPYPTQLPQDYYTKGLPPTIPAAPTVPSPPIISPIVPIGAVSYGGSYYGSVPPDDPQNGWLWTDTSGNLWAYIDPGVWSLVGPTPPPLGIFGWVYPAPDTSNISGTVV